MKRMILMAVLALTAACSDDDKEASVDVQQPEPPLSENFERLRIAGHANFTDASFFDENHGVLGAASGVMLRTEDGGASWVPVTGPMVSYSSVFMYDTQTIFAGRVAFYKMNPGNEMDTIGDLGYYTGSIRNLHFQNATTGFAVKANEVLKTTDGGNTWAVSHSANYLKHLFFATPQVAYAYGGTTHDGASGGVLSKTVDGGNTWTDITIMTSEILDLQFTDAQTGYAINFAHEFSKTTDGGLHWTKIGDIPEAESGGAPSSLLYVSDQQIFVTNYSGQLLKSADGGKNWEVLYAHPDGAALSKITRIGRKIFVVGDLDQILRN
ncbi:WD40/YVTN/BNR-like repeat-containing protein [Flavobacterium sp.]|uniref:WD40/YVTN/BNR-like repeat-containing protein n=1 Tax=Flavobacterium sp. TaxID=239 RepID=UPI0039E5F0DB